MTPPGPVSERRGSSRDGYGPLRREYSRIAGHYDARWRTYVDVSVRETLLRARVTPGESVLDVGCGTGAFLEALASEVPRGLHAGVDLSEDMLAVAHRRLGPGFRLGQAHAEALPFEDAVFDVVVSTNVFHFVRHPRKSLRELHRVLKPAGRIVITDWCDDYLACRVCDVFLRLFSRGHFRTYGTRACRRFLADAGFANPEVERYRITWLWGLMTATARKEPARPPRAPDTASRRR